MGQCGETISGMQVDWVTGGLPLSALVVYLEEQVLNHLVNLSPLPARPSELQNMT